MYLETHESADTGETTHVFFYSPYSDYSMDPVRGSVYDRLYWVYELIWFESMFYLTLF